MGPIRASFILIFCPIFLAQAQIAVEVTPPVVQSLNIIEQDPAAGQVVAVGDPAAFEGEGRVYVYPSSDLTGEPQVLAPSSLGQIRRFGEAIKFIDDINSDGLQDLVIAGPGDSGSTVGAVLAFLSQGSPSGVQYALCGLVTGTTGFGQSLSGAEIQSGVNSANLLIGSSDSSNILSFLLVSDSNGTCEFISPVSALVELTVSPSATPTIAPTATATPTVIPEDTPSMTPVPSPTAVASPDNSGPGLAPADSNSSIGGDSSGAKIEAIPVVVAPDSAGLPAPEVVTKTRSTEVRMPAVTPTLSGVALSKATDSLSKRLKISRARARKLISNPRNLIVTYVVEYSEVSSARMFSLIESAHADGGGRRTSKKQQIRSRRNSVSLRNLRPGVMYNVWYRVEISLAKPKALLGVTKPSPAGRFRAL